MQPSTSRVQDDDKMLEVDETENEVIDEEETDRELSEVDEEIIKENETNLERMDREYDLIGINEYDEIIYSSELYSATQGKIDPDKDYVYVSESAAGEDMYFGTNENKQYYVNNSTNDYYNWLTSFAFDKDGPRENVVINLQGEQIEAINHLTNKYFNLDKPAVFLTARYNVANDVLSVVLWKEDNSISLMYGHLGRPSFINIDLRTNLVMSVEELLERFGTNMEQAQQTVNDNLKRLGINDCNSQEEYYNCAFSNTVNEPLAFRWTGSSVNEISQLFIDDGNLRMYIYLYGEETYNQYGGEKHNILLMDVINPME